MINDIAKKKRAICGVKLLAAACDFDYDVIGW